MRELLYQILTNDLALRQQIPVERWVEGGNDLTNMPRPFAVLRQLPANPGIGGTYRWSCEVWVYDNAGDYTRIDSILDRVEEVLRETVGVKTLAHSLTVVDFAGRSADLVDDVLRANTRNSGFQLIGRRL